jgi:hypothetical protein
MPHHALKATTKPLGWGSIHVHQDGGERGSEYCSAVCICVGGVAIVKAAITRISITHLCVVNHQLVCSIDWLGEHKCAKMAESEGVNTAMQCAHVWGV